MRKGHQKTHWKGLRKGFGSRIPRDIHQKYAIDKIPFEEASGARNLKGSKVRNCAWQTPSQGLQEGLLWQIARDIPQNFVFEDNASEAQLLMLLPKDMSRARKYVRVIEKRIVRGFGRASEEEFLETFIKSALSMKYLSNKHWKHEI